MNLHIPTFNLNMKYARTYTHKHIRNHNSMSGGCIFMHNSLPPLSSLTHPFLRLRVDLSGRPPASERACCAASGVAEKRRRRWRMFFPKPFLSLPLSLCLSLSLSRSQSSLTARSASRANGLPGVFPLSLPTTAPLLFLANESREREELGR